MYKILSLNGGGIRGYITTQVLCELEKLSGKRIHQMFDLVVGTSAGAIIAAGSDHLPAAHMNHLVRNVLPPKLFKPNFFSFGGMFRTKYDTDTKNEALKEIIHDTASNIDYALVAYDIYNRRPVIFNSLEHSVSSKALFTTKYSMKDAVCASSAAPIYWDPYKLDNMVLVDGAYFANDPTSIGVKLALDGDRCLEDIMIVNVGTGYETKKFNFTKGHEPMKWMLPTLSIMMNSQVQHTSLIYSNEGAINYYNFDKPLHKASDAIDDISSKNIKNLETEAYAIINGNYPKLKEVIDLLLQ